MCPFGLTGVEIYLDRDLGRYDTIFPAAGTDASGVPMTLAGLAQITGGSLVDFTSNQA